MKKVKRYSSVSIALIALSAAVALLSNLGSSHAALQSLFISDPGSTGLQDILDGQIWRLITPIFIHFGLMHFAFNMIWVWDLGKLIESKKGAGFYIGFVLMVGALSNLAQYLTTESPFFGGMSGVVYGLFGYIWIRGRFDPQFAADLHKSTVIMMLAWFVLCWTGLVGPIANWAHTIGLAMGAAWAYLGSRSIDPAASMLAGPVPKEQRLEYLSTTDMLQLEAQRQWVRAGYQTDAQSKYDTIAGKLNIIDAILRQKSPGALSAKEQQSLEIAFGDALAQETGVQWAVLADGNDRAPVLIITGTPVTILPLGAISGLMRDGEQIDIQQTFSEAVHSINQQMKRHV